MKSKRFATIKKVVSGHYEGRTRDLGVSRYLLDISTTL